MDSAAYLRLYDNSFAENWSAAGARVDWDRIRSIVERRVPPGGTILDFGCYTGGLLTRLGAQFDRHGLEVNCKAAATARSTTGATIWESLAQLPPNLRFDAVIAADVVEHVHDPRKLIEQLLSLVAEDGVLILSTGDADHRTWRQFGSNWWYCYYPEHIAFISRAWLEFLCISSPSIVVLECEAFAYRQLAAAARQLEAIAMIFYGLLPRTFLALKRFMQQLRGRHGLPNVPGNGVGADHLLIVLARSHTA